MFASRFSRSTHRRVALCGVAVVALLTGAPAMAQVGVAGLQLQGGAPLNTANLNAHSLCGAGACTNQLSVAATGTAVNPETDFFVNNRRTIINWRQFDIATIPGGGADTVKFTFQARDDIVVNLISSPTNQGTSINGHLTGLWAQSNQVGGNIWIINSDGVVFGANAVVSTGGLLASTAQLTNQAAFLTDADTTPIAFSGAPAGSSVQVNGLFTGGGGTLAFIAPTVTTSATSVVRGADLGCTGGPCHPDVLYAAADAYSISFTPNASNDLDLFSFIVPAGGGTASTSPLTLAGTTTAGNVYIAAVNQAAVVGAVVAPGAITAKQAVGVNGDIVLSAGGGLQNTGGVVRPLANVGVGVTNASFKAPLIAGGSIVMSGDGSIGLPAAAVAQTGNIAITAAAAVDGPNSTLSAPVGTIGVTGDTFDLRMAIAGGDVTLLATGPGADLLTGGATSTNGDIAIDAGGDLGGFAALAAGLGTITVNAASFSFTLVQAGNGISLTSTGAGPDSITEFASTDTGNLLIDAAGSLNAAAAVLSAQAGAVTIRAASFDIGTATGANLVSLTSTGPNPSAVETLATSTNGDLIVQAGGLLTAADLEAPKGAITLTAASFQIGAANALNTIDLTGTGTDPSQIGIQADSQHGDVNVIVGGALGSADASLIAPNGSVIVSAGPNGTADPADAIVLSTVQAGNNLVLQGGAITLNGGTAGGPVLIRTAQLTLGGPLTGLFFTVASTAGNLNLGDNVFGPLPGLSISNATYQNLVAPIGYVAFYAGDPGDSVLHEGGTAAGTLTVGSLDVGVNSLNLFLFADAAHSVIFTGPVISSQSAGGAELVVGGLAPPTLANPGGAWTPGSILLEAQSAAAGGPAGSIGAPTAPFFAVNLNAMNDIVMGTQAFIGAVQSTPGGAINVVAGSPPVPAGGQAAPGEIYLTANSVSFLADGKIVQQNTTPGTGAYTGMLVQATVETPNPITVGCSSCATQPSVIDLIGVLIPLSGPPITGRALDDPGVITVLPPLGVNLQYRANGCVIGKPTVCGPVINIPIIPIVNELPPPDTLTNLLTLVPSPPLLDVGDFEGPADVTIIGSGNEEIWRKPDSRP